MTTDAEELNRKVNADSSKQRVEKEFGEWRLCLRTNDTPVVNHDHRY